MSEIHVSSLARVEATIGSVGARHLVTLLSENDFVRPAAIAPENHLYLVLNDIHIAARGMVLPGENHVAALIEFGRRWDRKTPLVVNCYAGVSRSTAAAYILAAALDPGQDEAELAGTLRLLSPSATPNPRLVAIADTLLGRSGRMVAAIAAIGRGADAFEGVPFALPVRSPDA